MTNKLYKLMNWAKIEEITYSECDNPHELLGPHKQGSKMLVQAFFPGAEKVTIHWKKTGQVYADALRSEKKRLHQPNL